VAGIAAELTIGEVAERAGVSVPTVRFYEARGLITSVRTAGNQRRFDRHVLRRLAFVAAASGSA
jgi:MerR family redox-sensitive transcriptional activator SoxR